MQGCGETERRDNYFGPQGRGPQPSVCQMLMQNNMFETCAKGNIESLLHKTAKCTHDFIKSSLRPPFKITYPALIGLMMGLLV